MVRTIVSRSIEAPIDVVFRAVSDIPNLPETLPCILDTEFLGETTSGVGTRFRETRRMGHKEMQTDLEVTEFIENERVRMVADSHGTIWDTLIEVEPDGDRTTLRYVMDAKAQKLLPRIMNPFVKGMFRKDMESHIDAVREFCEGG